PGRSRAAASAMVIWATCLGLASIRPRLSRAVISAARASALREISAVGGVDFSGREASSVRPSVPSPPAAASAASRASGSGESFFGTFFGVTPGEPTPGEPTPRNPSSVVLDQVRQLDLSVEQLPHRRVGQLQVRTPPATLVLALVRDQVAD